jgi:8-oxo-dGTP diphosphatase
LVFDDQQRLLVLQDVSGAWELPGGGWEHNESAEDCLTRELQEEIDATVHTTSPPLFLYVDHEPPGYYKLSIAFRVEAQVGEKLSEEDELVAKAFVSRDEFMKLAFQQSEKTIQGYVDQIWP